MGGRRTGSPSGIAHSGLTHSPPDEVGAGRDGTAAEAAGVSVFAGVRTSGAGGDGGDAALAFADEPDGASGGRNSSTGWRDEPDAAATGTEGAGLVFTRGSLGW